MDIKKIITEANHAIDALTNDKKATIASVRAYWVSYVVDEQPAFYLAKSLRTKAQIVARLQDLINWLNSFGRVNPYACGNVDAMTEAHEAALAEDFARLVDAQRAAGLPVDEEGNDLREWCGNDIEAAHAEALEEDDRFGWLASRYGYFWGGCNYAQRSQMIHDAHEAALTEENLNILAGRPAPAPAPAKDTEATPAITIALIRALPAVEMLAFVRCWCDMQTASDEWSHEEALMQLDHLVNGRLVGHELFMADIFARRALEHIGIIKAELLK